jgi:ERCC4-type nuclease
MLIIDNREGKLIELIKATPSFTIPYELKNLQLGDIIISFDKYPDKSIIIERKCVPDMLASIKDGRYKEQKIRLQAEKSQSSGNKIICYLIEGSSQNVRYPSEKKVFHGSLVSSIFRDEIPLIRSMSLIETLDIIIRMHDRMDKDITDFFKHNVIPINIPIPIPIDIPIDIPITTEETDNTGDNTGDNTINNIVDNIMQSGGDNNSTSINNNNENTYLNTIKKCKKENLTPKLWNQISLTNIPGISTNIAIKITEIYPTIKELFQAYNNCDTDEKRILLISEIYLVDNGKTKRRIGEVVSKRILEYLYKS